MIFLSCRIAETILLHDVAGALLMDYRQQILKVGAP